MKASELIAQLAKLISRHGDLEVKKLTFEQNEKVQGVRPMEDPWKEWEWNNTNPECRFFEL